MASKTPEFKPRGQTQKYCQLAGVAPAINPLPEFYAQFRGEKRAIIRKFRQFPGFSHPLRMADTAMGILQNNPLIPIFDFPQHGHNIYA
jgi:hypothetical protein